MNLRPGQAGQPRDVAVEVCGAVDAGSSDVDLFEALATRRERVPTRLGAHPALLDGADRWLKRVTISRGLRHVVGSGGDAPVLRSVGDGD